MLGNYLALRVLMVAKVFTLLFAFGLLFAPIA